MDIVDVGFYPSVLSSSLHALGATRALETSLATALQQARPRTSFEGRGFYLKRLSQSSAFETPRYHRRHRRTTGGSKGPSRISDDFTLMVT